MATRRWGRGREPGGRRPVILVDQDGPLADFERGFLEVWRAKHPEEIAIPVEERSTFYLRDQYPPHVWAWIDEIHHSPGFYRNLPPTPGAVEAMHELLELGFEVRICTSPLSRYENCVLEKYEWTERHLGRDFTKRMIVTKDKTLVRGRFLIDDRPEVTGLVSPEWEHVLFDYPYNRHVPRRRLTWANWREVLEL
jgi:5'-nucleotidase